MRLWKWNSTAAAVFHLSLVFFQVNQKIKIKNGNRKEVWRLSGRRRDGSDLAQKLPQTWGPRRQRWVFRSLALLLGSASNGFSCLWTGSDLAPPRTVWVTRNREIWASGCSLGSQTLSSQNLDLVEETKTIKIFSFRWLVLWKENGLFGCVT